MWQELYGSVIFFSLFIEFIFTLIMFVHRQNFNECIYIVFSVYFSKGSSIKCLLNKQQWIQWRSVLSNEQCIMWLNVAHHTEIWTDILWNE